MQVKTYTLAELKIELGITQYAWENRREELLEYFKKFFDYEITMQGKKLLFIIKEIYESYVPLPRKTKVKEIEEFYREETEHIIKYKPLNTGSNVAREIVDVDNRFNHKEDTAARYVRPVLKEGYKISDKKIWCEPNYLHHTYVPITPEQLEFLNKQFERHLGSEAKRTADLLAEAEAGYITAEELKTKLFAGGYTEAMKAFKEEYGFRPLKVGEYMKNAF